MIGPNSACKEQDAGSSRELCPEDPISSHAHPGLDSGRTKKNRTVGPEVGRRGLLDLRGRAFLGIHLAYSESPFKELSALPDCMIPRMPARPCQASADSIALRSHVSKKDSNEVFS